MDTKAVCIDNNFSLSKLKEVIPPALTTFADDEKYNSPSA